VKPFQRRSADDNVHTNRCSGIVDAERHHKFGILGTSMLHFTGNNYDDVDVYAEVPRKESERIVLSFDLV